MNDAEVRPTGLNVELRLDWAGLKLRWKINAKCMNV